MARRAGESALSLHFISPGLQTSVQDLGRPGLMHCGIPRGGAADPLALQFANLLLGNPADNPALEITLIGPEIEFHCDLSIAVCGGQFEMTLNDNSVGNDEVIPVRRGDTLQFGRLHSGARAYLALAGQMDIPPLFASASTHLQSGFGGLSGSAVKKGDTIPVRHSRNTKQRRLEAQYRLRYTSHPQLRLVTGAEEGYFDPDSRERLYSETYQVSAQSNRMGIRLSGAELHCMEKAQVMSSGLCPGTVQVPPSGQPIVSFVEGQTIGGYPRIAHVISADQHLLGQLQAHDRVSFARVSTAQAQEILAGKANLLKSLRANLSSST